MTAGSNAGRRQIARKARAPLGVAVAVSAAVSGVLVPTAAQADDTRPLVLRPFVCNADGVCLAYIAALSDKDRDGIPDIDEEAAGTNPADGFSTPTIDRLTDVIGKGALPSFEVGYSQVIVLPETFPDGTPIVRDITTAVVGRTSAIARMGVDGLLKQYGFDLGAGVVLDRAAGAIGMKLDKDGRPVRDSKTPPVQKRVGGIVMGWIGADAGGETGDGGPVDMSPVPGTMGKDRDQKDFWGRMWDGVKDMFSGDKKQPDKPDAGKPVTLTTGDEGNVVVPITDADMKKVLVKLGGTSRPVGDDPKVNPDITGVDLNPQRTIILTDDPVGSKLPADILKIVLTTPDPNNPADRNTNFGPNGGIVPSVGADSGWPKD